MRIDPVILSLGLVEPVEGPAPVEVSNAIHDAACGFLEAGGRLSWDEWMGMAPDTQNAFRRAGRVLWDGLAARAGLVAATPSLAVAVATGEDGTQEVAEAAARSMADKLEAAGQ